MLWRAFDKTVRRKPLVFAADAVYGNSIDLDLEAVAKKGVARKALLLMLVTLLLLAFPRVMVRRGSSSFKRRYAWTYTRGSVRRVNGFVLTGNPSVRKLRVGPRFATSGSISLPNGEAASWLWGRRRGQITHPLARQD